jgi:hypothetical protein
MGIHHALVRRLPLEYDIGECIILLLHELRASKQDARKYVIRFLEQTLECHASAGKDNSSFRSVFSIWIRVGRFD